MKKRRQKRILEILQGCHVRENGLFNERRRAWKMIDEEEARKRSQARFYILQ